MSRSARQSAAKVAAMGDGIERALARASELEVLVHNEVASLERSYSDNELRVRRLIDELVNEREAITQNAERVRQAMTGAQETLSSDLARTSDKLYATAEDAAGRISSTLMERSESLTETLSGTGDKVLDLIQDRYDGLFERLTAASENLSDAFVERGDGLIVRLGDVGGEINKTLTSNVEEFDNRLRKRTRSPR